MSVDSRPTGLASARVRTAIGVAGALIVVGAGYLAWPHEKSFDRLPTSSIKTGQVAFPDDPATLAFMQTAALSHVAPLRPEQQQLIAPPPRREPADAAERERRRERAAQRMTAKPGEVAALPPRRPRPEAAEVVALPPPAPAPEPTRFLGIEVKLPAMPDFPDVLPSGKQVRERASEWADKIASAVKFR